jgi:hypothetical protein
MNLTHEQEEKLKAAFVSRAAAPGGEEPAGADCAPESHRKPV